MNAPTARIHLRGRDTDRVAITRGRRRPATLGSTWAPSRRCTQAEGGPFPPPGPIQTLAFDVVGICEPRIPNIRQSMISTAAELVGAFWWVASNGRTFMEQGRTDAFWAELSACDHFVQIYEGDDVFMDTLVGYVAGGLCAGQGVIIIATPAHRQELDERLRARGLDVTGAKARDQFISVDAQETLAT